MQTISEQIVRKEYEKNVNECIQSLQQAVEMSFNKIDEQLDQLLNDKSPSFNVLPSQLNYDSSQLNFINQPKLQDDNIYLKQISQQVTSLIKNNIQNKKEQQCETIQQTSTVISTQSNLQSFTYQLMKQNSVQQQEDCYAIAVNKNCSILIAGCNEQIMVFEFQQGMLKLIEILSEHGNYITTLNFMKRQDQFISGSYDGSIIIWTRNQNNSWICQQKLNGHTNEIRCLVLNNNEDIIVSGSADNKIKFWQKQNEWLCTQTITDHTSYVYGLSFNEQYNKLISCGGDNLILIIEQSEQNKQWMVIQKITLEQSGFRLCFIDNNTFTFYPCAKDYINVFEMNSSNKQYTKTKDIPVKGGPDNFLFPSQYNQSKCILVNKNASNVSLIRKKQNGEFIFQQSIDFETNGIFGCMTDDGQYLITWDFHSEEYQIRKFQEK